MNRLEPTPTEVSDPFWDATREQRYLVQWCTACATPIFYPREVCPSCLSAESLEWRPSSGKGTVYAVSVQHRPGNPMMANRVPYAVAELRNSCPDGKLREDPAHQRPTRVKSAICPRMFRAARRRCPCPATATRCL